MQSLLQAVDLSENSVEAVLKDQKSHKVLSAICELQLLYLALEGVDSGSLSIELLF